MNVGELISLLSEMPAEAEIFLTNELYSPLYSAELDSDDEVLLF